MIGLWIVQTTLVVSLLCVVALLLGRKDRLSPTAMHALWTVILVRFLVPPGLLTWPWTLPDIRVATVRLTTDSPEQAPSRSPESEEPTVVRLKPESDSVEPTAQTSIMVVGSHATSPTSETPGDIDRLEIIFWFLAGVWLAGSLWILARHGRDWRRLRQWIRFAEPAPTELVRQVRALSHRLKVRPPVVGIVSGLPSPSVAGLISPVLLWPKNSFHQTGDAGSQTVLIHELAHLRRRDHLLLAVELLAQSIWWWHPLFYIVRRHRRFYAEFACDAWVVHLLPSSRRTYAQTILQVCEALSRFPEPAAVLGVGGQIADLKRRLEFILNRSPRCGLSRRAIVGLLGLALAVAPSWAIGTASDEVLPMSSESARSDEPWDVLSSMRQAPRPTANPSEIFSDAIPRSAHEWSMGPAAPAEETSAVVTRHYRLPPKAARRLGALLRSLADSKRLRVEVQEDGLLVTTRPADQPIVARLIDMIGRSPGIRSGD
jgi:beta-lactamase regulating signal transducer with metallopeptidase domain